MVDFTGMLKHVGVLDNTGKNVVIAFMSLPDDDSHALVIDTDALPDQYNDALRKVVESVEGQQAKNLGDVLGRRMSPDGQTNLLNKFHASGRLHKVPTNLVTMTPRRGTRWKLVDVLKAMNESKEGNPLGFEDLDPDQKAAYVAENQNFNVHANNMNSLTSSDRKESAMSLIRQAQLMEADAQAMRVKAYQLDPSQAPKKKGSDLPMLLEQEPKAKPKVKGVTKKVVEG